MALRAHPTQPPAVSDSADAMRGALTFAVRDMNRVGMTATAARWVLRRACQTGKSLLSRTSTWSGLTSKEAAKPQVAGSHSGSRHWTRFRKMAWAVLDLNQ